MTEPLEGERTVSEVASRKKVWFTPARKAAAIGVGVTVVLGFLFWKDGSHKTDDDSAKPPAAGMGQSVAYDPPKLAPMPAAFSPAMPPAPPPAILPAAPSLPPAQVLPQPSAPTGTRSEAKPPPRQPRMLSYSTGSAEHGATAGDGRQEASQAETRVSYKGSEIVGGKAGPALDRDLLLMPGIIRCVLDTAIDSTLPGPLMCHLPEPVISPHGVVLMEKDTQVIGQYTNDVKQGQGRLMAVSATAYTPAGVPVPLGGPFADALGRSGLDGNVNNHLMERFGGAVMLSLAQSALGIAQSSVSKGGNSYVSFSSGGVGSLAQDVLRNTINIPPTITKDAGEEVSIWILTPIDFSAAYHLTNR